MARAVFGGGLSPYITKAQDRPTPYNPLGALSTAIRQPFVEDVIVPGISRIRDEMRIAEQEEQIAAQAQGRRDAARSAMGKAFFREAQAKMPEVPTMPSLASLSDSAVVDAQQIGSMSRQLEDMVAQGMPSSALRQQVGAMDQLGLGGVAREILQGATAQESLRAAQVAKLKSQLRRQISAPAPEAVAGPQMLQPSMKGERLLLKNEGQYENPLQRKVDLLARRAYERTEGSREQKLEAAMAAAQAAQPEAIAAQEVQAVERPELLEEAAAFREQATALEAEAKGIEATPVYRTFGDHAMAFLDALDSGDVATQMALMESVGGSTDYQPFGKGAVGKAIGKDASMRARRDLLDLKKKYLDAKRREDSAIKIAEKKAELRGKKKRTGGRGGGGYGRKDKVLMDALVALNRGDSLTENDKRLLRATKELTPAEIESLTPDRPAAWQALRTSMRGKRARADAKSIMSGQPTPEEREVRKVAADEKAAQNAIKKLEAEVRLATGEEKKRKAQELERMRLDTKIGSATTRLDTAATDLIKAEFAVEASLREQSQLLKAIGRETDETRKANQQAQLANAQAKEKAQERIRATLAAKEKRLDKELKALEAKRRAQPAKAN